MPDIAGRLSGIPFPLAATVGSGPVVTTPYGKVLGQTKDGVTTFKGVPFAAPPVGKLRFFPPQPPQAWSGVLDCTRFRDSAIQASEFEPLISRSEDCLYLNIWAPDDAADRALPVLIFIHGGGYSDGSPAKGMYEGSRFARDGVIQVNISYRLGSLGFLALEEVEAQCGMLGNAGTLDQIAALRWVQNSIAAFGGDPARVTICGESAGAFSVSNLMMSPLAKGLFHRAIMESGNLLGQPIVAPLAGGDPSLAKLYSRAYAASLGAGSLEELQRVDAKRLAKGSPFQDDMTALPDYTFWPVFDGKVIPEDPYGALTKGQLNAVDVLAGYNTDEGTIFIPRDTDEEEYILLVAKIFGEQSLEVLDRYPVDARHTPTSRARRLVEMGLRMGSELFAEELSRQGHKVWFYNFDYSLPVLDRVGLGAMHALELIYVFDTAPRILVRDDARATFKEDVHNRWLNFVKSGDPNKGAVYGVEWPCYTPEGKETLVLNLETRVVRAPHAGDVAFYRDLLWGTEN